MKSLNTILICFLVFGCVNKSHNQKNQIVDLENNLCFDSNMAYREILPFNSNNNAQFYLQELNWTLVLLDAVNKDCWKDNIIFIQENDKKIDGRYLYQDIDNQLNQFKTKNDTLISKQFLKIPKGFIAVGYNDLINNSNFEEFVESFEKDNLSAIDFKINYKFWLVFLHESAHSFQYNNLEKQFLSLRQDVKKRFILELNADYIAGIFFTKIMHEQLRSQFKEKRGDTFLRTSQSIDFSGFSNKYKFNVSLRQSPTKKIEMFKKIGEALFNEMKENGDLLVGQGKHHGTNAERATAFYNGYEVGLQEPYNQNVLNQFIYEDLKYRINQYNKTSELW